MIEDRPHRSAAEPATALPRRLRAWLGLAAEPSLHRRRAAAIEPVHRSWLAAFWQARISVRAGVPLALLMVGYTVFSLWIIAQPIVLEPGAPTPTSVLLRLPT